MWLTFLTCSRTRMLNSGELTCNRSKNDVKNLESVIWGGLWVDFVCFYYSYIDHFRIVDVIWFLGIWVYLDNLFSEADSGKKILVTYSLHLCLILFVIFVGKRFWSRVIAQRSTESCFIVGMGDFGGKRKSVCALHCRTWKSPSCCNCLHVLVLWNECKF